MKIYIFLITIFLSINCFGQKLELKDLILASKNNVSEILYKSYIQKGKTFIGQNKDSIVINQGEINWFGNNKIFNSILNGIDSTYSLELYFVDENVITKMYKKDFIYYIFSVYLQENRYAISILTNVDNQGE